MEHIIDDPRTWVAVAFVVFMAGFIKYALPKIIRMLDARSAQIQDELNRAVSIRKEAEVVLAEYQQKQREMLAVAEQILQQASDDADRMKANAEEAMKEIIKRRSKSAQEKIERAQQDALRLVQANMVQIATEAARNLVVEHVQAAGDDDLIDYALEQVERIVH